MIGADGWNRNLLQQPGDPLWHIHNSKKPIRPGNTGIGVWASVCGLVFEPVTIWQSGDPAAIRDPMCPACLKKA